MYRQGESSLFVRVHNETLVSLCVKLLIAKGADINARSNEDRHGLTALEQARFMRNIEVVRVLEKAGAR
jgi:ankyrin repeat protein